MCLGLHSKFCKGSVGRIYFLFLFFIFYIKYSDFLQNRFEGRPPHPPQYHAFLFLETKKQSEVKDAKQYVLNENNFCIS